MREAGFEPELSGVKLCNSTLYSTVPVPQVLFLVVISYLCVMPSFLLGSVFTVQLIFR